MYTLHKRERIHLKKQIDELFTQGESFVVYPLRVVYLLQKGEPAQNNEGPISNEGRLFLEEEIIREGEVLLEEDLPQKYETKQEWKLSQQDFTRGSMLVSVAKKHFKRANKRNRVKRLIREAYRLNKHIWLTWLEDNEARGRIAFIFVGKDMPSYKRIALSVEKIFSRIIGIDTLK